MRISDWSSDVCSSDLMAASIGAALAFGNAPAGGGGWRWACRAGAFPGAAAAAIVGASCRPSKSEAGTPRKRRTPAFWRRMRSEEHTSELQSLMRISYAVFCLKKKKKQKRTIQYNH